MFRHPYYAVQASLFFLAAVGGYTAVAGPDAEAPRPRLRPRQTREPARPKSELDTIY